MRGNSRKNIGLIGFMGTGKSTIGKALAESTNKQFFDTDKIIEEKSGKTVSLIFEKSGENVFRRLESDVVVEVCQNESAVISFGGGVVLSSSNVETIRKSCVVVLLRATVDSIFERTHSMNVRPLLNEQDRRSKIGEMLDTRMGAYESSMDIAVDTDFRDPLDLVEEIRRRLKI
ncbi:MAG: shikimate kinase [Candidatus Thorarchaeota archaeon]